MSRCGRFALNLAAMAALAGAAGGAAAQSTSPDPYMAKQLSNAVRGNLFMRLGYTSISVSNKSSDAYDVTGPVVTSADLNAAAALGDSLPASDPLSPANFDIGAEDGATYGDFVGLFTPAVDQIGGGLGTPRGIKAKVGNAATTTLSMGYWLTDEHTWVAEAYVLAAPMTVKAYGEGTTYGGRSNGLAGKEVLSTKMLPPLVSLGRYFGAKDSRFRPYAGLGATYAVFFDTKASAAYNDYVGGRSSAKLKNAFGVGPFVGLMARIDDDWHVSVSLGQIRIKTEATLTTYNTQFQSGDRVLQDYNQTITQQITLAQRNADSQFVTKLMQLVARNRGGSDLGTYVRKQDQTLTNTVFNLSIGRSF